MIETKYICDRCAAVVKQGDPFYRLERQVVQTKLPACHVPLYTDGIVIHDYHSPAVHLCNHCTEDFFIWVKNGKVSYNGR